MSRATRIREYQFPDSPSKDADQENQLNYLVWKTQQEKRKRELRTQFNRFRTHNSQRLYSHMQYKDESEQQIDALREEFEKKLDTACGCHTCYETQARRKSSPDSAAARSATRSVHMAQSGGHRTRSLPTSTA